MKRILDRDKGGGGKEEEEHNVLKRLIKGNEQGEREGGRREITEKRAKIKTKKL